MEYQFEEFTALPEEQVIDRIYATINKRGNIHLNRRAVEALGQPERVVLLYDMRQSTIGVARAPEHRPNGYKLRRKDKAGRSRIIYAANFCRHYHIQPEATTVFTDAKVNKEGILILNFREATTVRRK